ncbi:MAG TPA: hypothetical protein VKG86_10875 [Terracidiphilus sp.]|nr:hypothetical protein [Terracidiphilus sp.]
MFNRFRLGALLLICLVVPFFGCGSATELDSITVTPATVNFGGVGLTAQLSATGTINHGTHPATTVDVTDQVTWSTGSKDVATVSAAGVVTSTGPGSIQITASINGFTGLLSSSSTVTVTTTSPTGPTNTDVTSLSIIPSAQSVASPNDTSQFIAIGTTASGATENLTSQVVWSSSSAQIATICTAGSPAPCTASTDGLATGVGQGNATITALYTNVADQTVVTGTATFTVTSGGGVQAVTALSIDPASESLSASGGTGQLIALATYGGSGLIQDVTNSSQLTWISSVPTYASITSGLPSGNGVVKGVSAGSVTITAEWTNPASGGSPSNVVTATASITVTSTPAPEPLLSLTIIPTSLSVLNLQGTGQFLAIGTFSSAPFERDLTDSVTWISSFPNMFPVDTNTGGNTGASAGIVTAYGSGGATIIAEATSSDGTIQTATATFSCPLVLPNPPTTPGSCFPGSEASELLSTVTVYNEGLNTTNWLVTAPSATGTVNVIHCGPGWTLNGGTGGSVCVATYPIGTPITLTATQSAGSTGTFGGWSSNCTPNPNPPTAAGPNTCTLMPTTYNETVGAIFN